VLSLIELLKNMSKKKQGKQQKNKSVLFKDIVIAFNQNPKKLFNYKQLAADLDIHSEAERMLISQLLNDLKDQNFLEEVETRKIQVKTQRKIHHRTY
jgi:ribonuclease R